MDTRRLEDDAKSSYEIRQRMRCSAMEKDEIFEDRNDSEIGRKDRGLKSSSRPASSKSSHRSDPFYSPMSERMERSKVEISHRREASFGSQKALRSDYLLDIAADEKQSTHSSNSQTRHLLKDVCHSLTTSKQLLKVLSRIWSIEEQRSTCISLFATLKSELDRACHQASKLIQEQKQNQGEIDSLLRFFEEQKMKEQYKIQSAIGSVVSELKTEKKLRRQAERLNKKLGRELCEAKTSLTTAEKEAESQRKAMEVLERVCEELAKGVGDDKKAKMEEIKKEREMLQLADKLREERVQMKLSDAKHEYEAKLKADIEAYVTTTTSTPKSSVVDHEDDVIKALKKHLSKTLPGKPKDCSDSADSDLHSIELNMDENSKSFEWRINTTTHHHQERQTSDAIEWEFSNNGGLMFESGSSEAWRNDYEDEIERYNMIKDLRDHFVSAAKSSSGQPPKTSNS